jgi:hypothetical protein
MIIVIAYVVIYLILMYRLHKKADEFNDYFKPKN